MNINIGLTGWSDHPSLYEESVRSHEKLQAYASHFPVVEVDTAFYAIQKQTYYEKWVKDTPRNFSFVIKAFRGLTGHDREKRSKQELHELMEAYKESIEPVVKAGKLNALLFQFPPWFDVKKENIQKMRQIREWLKDYPVAIEFRNQSWYREAYRERTLSFLEEEGFIHTVCDEPQAGEGSVPAVVRATNKDKTLIRLHGRNVHGWEKNGHKDWRAVRFLYNYNEEELKNWVPSIEKLLKESNSITMLFNNNSGHDAAANAKEMMGHLGVSYEGLNPRQLDLF